MKLWRRNSNHHIPVTGEGGAPYRHTCIYLEFLSKVSFLVHRTSDHSTALWKFGAGVGLHIHHPIALEFLGRSIESVSGGLVTALSSFSGLELIPLGSGIRYISWGVSIRSEILRVEFA